MSGWQPPDPPPEEEPKEKPKEETKEKPKEEPKVEKKSNESCETERIGQEAKVTIFHTANEG